MENAPYNARATQSKPGGREDSSGANSGMNGREVGDQRGRVLVRGCSAGDGGAGQT